MKNNILFTVTNLDLLPKLKGLGIEKFVYPLSFFCAGIKDTFTMDQITEENSYLFINRILDCKGIDELKNTLKDLPKNIKGIVFDDLGVLSIIKDLPVEKILYQSHFANNYASINYLLKYVDTLIVSCDITENEIDEIISKANKKLSLFTFGLTPALYSRRTLVKNYALHNNVEYENIKKLNSQEQRFISIEDEFGTFMYHYPYFDGTRLLTKDVKYFFYFPILLSDDKILNVASNNFEGIETCTNFLDIKTIYKIRKD